MIKHEIKTLKNGLRLITSENNQTEAVTILILVGAGGRFERKDQIGMTHFLEHMFFKGSKNYPTAFDISRELDSIGSHYNAHPMEESTVYYVQSSVKDFKKAFSVVTDMYLNPVFDEQEFEPEKNVIIAEINMHRDIPQSHVQSMNQEQMYGDHPLGYNLGGTVETISKMTKEDTINFRKALYTPENTIIAIAGNPTGADWEKEVEELFSNLEKSEKIAAEPYKSQPVSKKFVQEVRKIDQTHLALSYFALSKDDPRKYAMMILNSILGGGASSRLFMEIREKRGLAYYVSSGVATFADSGLMTFVAGIEPSKVKIALEVLQHVLKDITENGPTEEELARAKGNIRGTIALSLENSSEIASFLAEDLLAFSRIRSIDEIIESVEQVSTDEVQSLAKEIFKNEKMGLSIIGPKEYDLDL